MAIVFVVLGENGKRKELVYKFLGILSSAFF